MKSTVSYPNVANLHRGKTRQGATDVASRSLGQVEAYLTVREILAEASKGAYGALWPEFSGFGRFSFATLGVYYVTTDGLQKQWNIDCVSSD